MSASGPLERFAVYADTTGGVRNTGLALVNVGSDAASVNFRLYDSEFHLVAMRTLQDVLGGGDRLEPGLHLARYATEIFAGLMGSTGTERGTIMVESDQPLAALTLRQHDDLSSGFPQDVYLVTTFPVIPVLPTPD